MNYTQKGLAEECGVCEDIVRRVYRGKNVRLEYAERISRALCKPCGELFEITHKREETLSSSTIRRIHSLVSVVFSQAEKEMLIQFNPAQKVTLPKMDQHNPNYFQPEQITDILEALEKEPIRWQAMINLFIVTGCRRGEILGLKWEKVDFQNRQVKIDCCLSYLAKHGIYEGPTKTKNTRFITLPEETVVLLRKYKAWQAEQRLLYGNQWTCSDYVFTGDKGGPMMPTSVNCYLRRSSKKYGLPFINPHSLRHSFASVMISSGVDIVTVSKLLGHAKTSMTTDVYSHLIEESKRKATECIADAILRKKKA